MTTDPRRSLRFRYDAWDFDAATGRLTCRYSLDDLTFAESVLFETPGNPEASPQVEAAARLVFLLSGISYYKAGAPPVIDLGDTAITLAERDFLRSYYVNGLAEYAYKNGLDLSDLVIEAQLREPQPAPVTPTGRPLVPFGGGIDSIVVVEQTRAAHPDLSLFVASRAGDRFAAIEKAAAVTGLPIARADREIDGQILRSRELGLLNGHVPVTGILSSLAVMSALLGGRDSVVMSNEWSASSGTLAVDGRVINHQWSKSLEFETGLRGLLAESLPGFEYFSALRPYSELWVGRRFAALEQYHHAFRSCNRSFQLDPALRWDRWCGECDKCCFIDLILSPFLARTALETIFDGREPLSRGDLEPRFRSLLGDPELVKPFECVGDEGECRVATLLAADRPDRAETALLQALSAEIRANDRPLDDADELQLALGDHYIPREYAQSDQLV